MSEQLTIGFADAEAGLHGVAHAGSGALLFADGALRQSATAVLEERGGVTAARAEGLFDVELEPLGARAAFAGGRREWQCRVRGSASGRPLACLGQRVVDPAPPDWNRLALVRAVSVWLADDLGFACRAERPAAGRSHEDEVLEAFILRGQPLEPTPIAEPRLSSSYGADGRLLRAGVELWETEESDFALRVAGDALATGELALAPGGRLAAAFFSWRHEGRVGGGRYDILTRA